MNQHQPGRIRLDDLDLTVREILLQEAPEFFRQERPPDGKPPVIEMVTSPGQQPAEYRKAQVSNSRPFEVVHQKCDPRPG
jgi:hypothetical protein